MAAVEVQANRSVVSPSAPPVPAARLAPVTPPVPAVRLAPVAERPPTRHAAVSAPRLLAPVACGHRRAPVPFALVLTLALAVCLVVVGLGVLANAGSGAPTVPHRTAVVRVQPGEGLLDVAERVAPHSDTGAVADRIRELNGLSDSALRPGQPLTVPTEG